MMSLKNAGAWMLAMSLFAAASAAADPPNVRAPATINPGALRAPVTRNLTVQRPEFEITQITPVLMWPQQRITGVTVTINDRCAGVASGAPYVDVYVTDPSNPSNYVHMGYNAIGFVNGAHADTQTAQVPGTAILPQTSTIRVTVNASKDVLEAWSGNNSRQINPSVSPFPPGKNYCLPANYEQ
jgi:hypothetical protein